MPYCKNNEHNFEILSSASTSMSGGSSQPSYMKCGKCPLTLTSGEALQLMALEKQIHSVNNQAKSVFIQEQTHKHLIGFQKKINLWALVVSISAITISLISLFR